MHWSFQTYDTLSELRIAEWTREAQRDRLARDAAAARAHGTISIVERVKRVLGLGPTRVPVSPDESRVRAWGQGARGTVGGRDARPARCPRRTRARKGFR